MLRTIVTSKAAKLAALCGTPVAGGVGVTMGVPEVRQAVHKATAPRPAVKKPRAYAKPKTRVRAPEIACPPAEPVVIFTPIASSEGLLPVADLSLPPLSISGTSGTSGFTGPSGGFTTPGGGTFVPSVTPPQPPGPGPETPPPSAVPEPWIWVQMLVGFALIGGTLRISLSLRRKAGPAAGAEVG